MILLVAQSRNIKCLLGSGLLSILGSTVTEDDGVCPCGGGNSIDSSYVPGSTKNGVRQGVIKCHMADYKLEGRNELLRALVLCGFRFLGYSPCLVYFLLN